MMKPLRIVLADDQTLVREGLCSLLALNHQIEVVAQADDGEPVLALLQQHQPDLLLLDVQMPKVCGLAVLQQLQQRSCRVPVLILSTFAEHDLVLQCIRLGAKGYLRKDVRFTTLMQAIHSLVAGHTWFQPAVSGQIEQQALPKDRSKELPTQRPAAPTARTSTVPLTLMETQVLRLMAAGYSNHEIAAALYKASGTVRNQVSSILSKLDVRDRTRAVLKALDLKLI